MFENFNLARLWESFIDWCEIYLFSINTLYQGIIVLTSFVLGGLIYHGIRKKINKRIENYEGPAVARRIIRNLARLVYPLTVLALIFIATEIIINVNVGVDVGWTTGTMKVLLAWIAIRIAVQFIANSAIRNFFAMIIWIIAALSIFGILDDASNALDTFAFSIGEFRLSALTVIKSALMLAVLLYLAIFVSSFVERQIFQAKSLTRTSQVLLAKVIRVVLIVFALLIGVTSAGLDLSLFAVFGGAVGLGVGFGLQKGISNLFSGMLLLLDRSIKPGDVIEIPDIGTFGWVNNMAARYTEIVTRDNKSFLIPNEDFITQRVINWSHGNSLVRIHLGFGVHYESDPHQVMEVAIEATKELERVVDNPAPVCWITELGDSSINFDLRFWIKDAEGGVANIRGLVFLALWDAFKEHDIQIPYPHREVFIHDADKAKPKEKPKKKKEDVDPSKYEEDENPAMKEIKKTQKKQKEKEKAEAEKKKKDSE
ncbi:MAG: mechanosensitive ion channel [Alphaproteobacteria bacterium]|nr:mechanosensitive ion channel [Alphaproteobacteria bacterium]